MDVKGFAEFMGDVYLCTRISTKNENETNYNH